jgi:hypothetical protein
LTTKINCAIIQTERGARAPKERKKIMEKFLRVLEITGAACICGVAIVVAVATVIALF